MVKKLVLLIGMLAAGNGLFAQHPGISIKGKVVNAKTDEPVPFATLGIEGKSIGTVASENGEFAFAISAREVSADEQLIVSCIGFEDLPVRISSFRGGSREIRLEPQTEELEEVTVQPGKVKE